VAAPAFTSTAAPLRRSEYEAQLQQLAIRYRNDPLAFCLGAWRWGKGSLEDMQLKVWQRRRLDWIGQQLRAMEGQPHQKVRVATATGHGVGKSALMAMLSHWAMATGVDCRGVVTANTDLQLSTKTWAEMEKWNKLCIFGHWFQVTGAAIAATGGRRRSWRVDKVPWSSHTSEAFAGLHNARKRLIIFFDEASAIDDGIWEVTEGALTDEYTQILWIVFGNPTRTTGRFHRCFGADRDRWECEHLDAREVEGTDKQQIDEWAEDYGEDSDFFRVRVRGLFPRMSDMQFISTDAVDAARKREGCCRPHDPLIMGIDVARGGDCESVITFRKGKDARSIPSLHFRGRHTEQMKLLTYRAADEWRRYGVDAIFVDADGVGAGVYEDLLDLGAPVIGVRSGRNANDPRWGNKRAECWGELRDWLENGGAIEDDEQLATDLCGPEYQFKKKSNALILTPKEDMERILGLHSPDRGDALAYTFYAPVAPRANAGGPDLPTQVGTQYDVLKGPPAQHASYDVLRHPLNLEWR
jgi:hypothetical protein